MKKRKNSPFRLSIFVLALLALIPTGCEKESIEENNFNSNTLATENHVSYVNQNQIPNVIHAIYELTGNTSMKTAPNQKAISYNKTKIKTDKILKVKNKGFVNYTFKVLVENAPSNEFYNLIVTEDDAKKIKKPYILKYVVENDALSLFKANNNNFQYFKGNRYIVPFDNFFNSKKSNAKTTNETCPESTGYINNIPGGFGGGSDGGINNVPPTNLVQLVFNYFPNNFTGYFELWMNSYDTSTNQSTSIGGTVPNSTGVYIPSYQPSPINPITGGSQISSLTITWSVGGTFTYKNCKIYLDGMQECSYTTINYYVPDRPVEEVNERLTNETNDCPKIVGEIAVITPETPDCDPELQNVYGECVEDDYIFSDSLIGKEKCLNDLLDKNGNTYVQNLLKNFRGKSEFDINIVSKNKVYSQKTGDEINASCSPPVNKLITIEISTSRANSNKALEVARTILHEYIHADMFRKLNTDSTLTSSEDLEFLRTYNSYEKTTFEPTQQHQTMADLYIISMRDALKHFHKKELSIDYNKYVNYFGEAPSDTFYEAIAWRGLRDHNVNAYLILSDEKKELIRKEIENISYLTGDCP